MPTSAGGVPNKVCGGTVPRTLENRKGTEVENL